MSQLTKFRFGWDTPVIGGYSMSSLALKLGHIDKESCNARKQGSCPGQHQCSDCAWSEGPSRKAR